MSDEEAVAAYRETGSVWKAGKRLGIVGQSVHERLRRLGVPLAHQEWSRAELEEAQRLAVQGEPLAQIAARVGRTYHAVALKLSRTGVGSRRASWRWKPKRTEPLSRSRVHAFATLLNQEGWSVRRLARREGIAVTPLVDALQVCEPDAWHRYVVGHSPLRPRVCPGCRTRFVPLTGKQRFCTVRCRESHRRDLAYFGGRRLEAAGLRDGICQLCGQLSTKWITAHHVLGRDNDPDNAALIALCRGCHDLVTRLAARPWVEEPDVVADLIALCLARRGQLGALVTVDIDRGTAQEIRHSFGASERPLEDRRTRASKGNPPSHPKNAQALRRGLDSYLPEIRLNGLGSVGRAEQVHLERDGT